MGLSNIDAVDRRGGFLLSVGVLLCVALIDGAGAQAAEVDAEAHALHARAVEQARRGAFGPALRSLERLYARHPAHHQFLHDYVLVLSWAGRDEEALDLAPAVGRFTAPPEVLEALAKAARNLQRFDQAVSLYRQALARQPGRLESRIGLGLALADVGRPDEASKSLELLLQRHGDNPEVWFSFAYAAEARGDFPRAIWAYDRILDLSPENRRALRLKALAVAALGAPHLALKMASRYPGLLENEEVDKLRGDRAAVQVRWGALPPLSPEQRFVETDKALRMLDELYGGDWSQIDLSQAANQRLAFDRIVASWNRVRVDEVLTIYRQLQAAAVPIPDYALEAVAGAYLYVEQPEEAFAIYREVAARDRANFNARLGTFYAYVELDDFKRALAAVDELAASEPAWIEAGRERIGNSKREIAEIAAAYGRGLADDLAVAQGRFEAMLDLSPQNTVVRKELATVYRWRGWPGRALAELSYIERREPGYVANDVQLAETELELALYPEAERRILELTRSYPEHKHVQRLARGWAVHNRPELLLSVRGAEADGVELGTSDVKVDGLLYSKPLAYNYRAFLHQRFFQAEFEEGIAVDHRVGAGLEFRRGPWDWRGELYGGIADHDEAGFGVQAGWRPSDRWRLEGLAEYNSLETPLRAIGNGISAHRLGAAAAFTWHESQRASLAYRYLDFDDDNRRHSLFGAFERRLLNWPKFKATGIVDLYASTNSESDVIYYSPKKDFAWTFTLLNDWRLYRRYERSFSHRLRASVGRYHEEDFIPGTTWSFAYEHEWQWSWALNFTYGVARSRRFFDGAPEFETAGFATLALRF